MLFNFCRAQPDTAAADVVPNGSLDAGMKAKARKAAKAMAETKIRKGKGKGKANVKTTKHFAGYCLLCKAW